MATASTYAASAATSSCATATSATHSTVNSTVTTANFINTPMPSGSGRALYCCSICKHFSSVNYSSVLRHIGVVHSHEANFSLTCGVNGCIRNFHNYYSFRKHLKRLHPEVFSSSVTSTSQVEVTIDESDNNIDEEEEIGDHNTLTIENQRVVYESHSQISHEDEERSFALFLLKTKEMLCISQKATNEIMNDVIEIVN